MDHGMAPVTHVMHNMMHMTFYWGKVVTILFEFWRVKTWTWFAVSLVVVFLVSVLHEWFASVRARIASSSSARASEEEGVHRSTHYKAGAGRGGFARRVVESLLFSVVVGLRYLLMLAAMSFNGGVFVAIMAGLTLGHFLFRSNSADCG